MNNPSSKPARLVQHASIAELIDTYGEPSPEAIEADRANLEAIVQWLDEGESDFEEVIDL